MRNFKAFEQIDFSGGINTRTPPNQLEENECQALLNMFPTRSGKEIETRRGFANAAIHDFAYPVKTVAPYKGYILDGTTVTAVPGVIAAMYNGTAAVIYAEPLGGTLPAAGSLPDDMVWTDQGTDFVAPPDDGGGTPPTFTPIVFRFTSGGDNLLEPTWGHTNTKFRYAEDIWTSESKTAYMANDNNPSVWGSESAEANPAMSLDVYNTNYYNLWHQQYLGSDSFRFFWDSWTPESPDTSYGKDIYAIPADADPGRVEVYTPVVQVNKDITGETYKSPFFEPPTMTFTLRSLEGNSWVYFRFNHTPELNGAAVVIQYRPKVNQAPYPAWSTFNTKNGVMVPVLIREQMELAEEADRWLPKAGGPNEGYITCGRLVSGADTEFRVQFRVSEYAPNDEDAAGILHSLLVSATEV